MAAAACLPFRAAVTGLSVDEPTGHASGCEVRRALLRLGRGVGPRAGGESGEADPGRPFGDVGARLPPASRLPAVCRKGVGCAQRVDQILET